MPLATTTDVRNRLGRALASDEETVLAATLLADAEGRLTGRVPTLLLTASDDADYRSRVVAIESEAVARVLRNPDGYRSESTGPFSYQLDTRAAAGFLTILKEEWQALGVSTAGTIAPYLPMPTTMPFSVYDLLYGWR